MPSALSGTEVANSQIAPVPFVWSIAQRVSHDLVIQASIEYVSSPLVLICMISFFSLGLGVAVSPTCRPSCYEGNFNVYPSHRILAQPWVQSRLH
jgi:hypothetical protein